MIAISQGQLFLWKEQLLAWFNLCFLEEQFKCKNCVYMKIGNGSGILYWDLEFVSK